MIWNLLKMKTISGGKGPEAKGPDPDLDDLLSLMSRDHLLLLLLQTKEEDKVKTPTACLIPRTFPFFLSTLSTAPCPVPLMSGLLLVMKVLLGILNLREGEIKSVRRKERVKKEKEKEKEEQGHRMKINIFLVFCTLILPSTPLV
jgi:hypothetical protein